MLAHAEACERNKEPILAVLREAFAPCSSVLEVGSGTGQHAVHFATHLPWLSWQPSERGGDIAALQQRIAAEGPANLRPAIEFDVMQDSWPTLQVDGVFSANTLHIMGWLEVEAFFASLPELLAPSATLAIYGPFNYGGQFSSASNASFEDWLKARDPVSGIRDFEAVDALARQAGFTLVADHAMPANNQLLVWTRRP